MQHDELPKEYPDAWRDGFNLACTTGNHTLKKWQLEAVRNQGIAKYTRLTQLVDYNDGFDAAIELLKRGRN